MPVSKRIWLQLGVRWLVGVLVVSACQVPVTAPAPGSVSLSTPEPSTTVERSATLQPSAANQPIATITTLGFNIRGWT